MITAVCAGRRDLQGLAALSGVGIVNDGNISGNAVAVELDALCGVGCVLCVVVIEVVVPDERTEFCIFGRNIGIFVKGCVAGILILLVIVLCSGGWCQPDRA